MSKEEMLKSIGEITSPDELEEIAAACAAQREELMNRMNIRVGSWVKLRLDHGEKPHLIVSQDQEEYGVSVNDTVIKISKDSILSEVK
jgi:hypothetical protein